MNYLDEIKKVLNSDLSVFEKIDRINNIVNHNKELEQRHFQDLVNGIEEDVIHICEDNEVIIQEIKEYFTTFRKVHFE